MNYSLSDLIPELTGLAHRSYPISVERGGQSTRHACHRIVNDSLLIDAHCSADADNITAIAAECLLQSNAMPFPFYLGDDTQATVLDVYYAANHGTLCSSMNGSAPEIRISYSLCKSTYFAGWQRSELGSLSQWIGPLVQFILPCLAFCLSIPRSWRFKVHDKLFDGRPSEFLGMVFFVFRLFCALILVSLDTLVWLACCFAFAGPILLSALVEYMLDKKVLEHLVEHTSHLTPKTRIRLLLAIVAGNLRDTDTVQGGTVPLPAQGATGTTPSQAAPTQPTTWDSVMNAVDYESKDKHSKDWIKLWLKSLLNTQMSFGSAVGAPIVFFIGGFIYNVIDADSSRGDGDTAEALAFGMWWMVIPHTAIIASAMLASNNPGAMQGMLGAGAHPLTAPADRPWYELVHRLFQMLPGRVRSWQAKVEKMELIERAYDTGKLEPVSAWDRGLNKRKWINKVIEGSFNSEKDDLRRAMRIRTQDQADILFRMVVLLGAPIGLAFATAYRTPRIGLGCRSTTHLVYFLSQLVHIALWGWGETGPMRKKRRGPWARAARIFCTFCQVVTSIIAVFSSIGGTLMQIIGVYRNCVCKVPAKYWLDMSSPGAYGVFSNITQEAVDQSHDWVYLGLTAGGVLAIVASLGWWHQRRLRRIFQQVAGSL